MKTFIVVLLYILIPSLVPASALAAPIHTDEQRTTENMAARHARVPKAARGEDKEHGRAVNR